MSEAAPQQQKIVIFVSYSGSGGVERVINNLCAGFLAAGHPVELLLIKARGPHLKDIPAGVEVTKLAFSSGLLCLFPLMAYLRRERPPVLLSAKKRANLVALLARRFTGVPTRVVVRMETNLTESVAQRHPWHQALSQWLVRRTYSWAEAIIAVSEDAADDLAKVIGLPRERVRMIPNPAIPANIEALAQPAPHHPWFTAKACPILLGVGRLTLGKDFATLLRAFARLRERRTARLVILGEGHSRGDLEALAGVLGVAEDVWMPGFCNNPYPFMAHADLLALSSLHEGLGMVLVEALALGTPVVATDCRSGPREVTQDGRYGELVPVGDSQAMADAMERTLDGRPDREALRAGVSRFTVAASTRRHLEVMGLA
jgi:glycosyltransferase involved in cell wall biosynthesis